MLPRSDGNGGLCWHRAEDGIKFFIVLASIISIISGVVTAYVLQGQKVDSVNSAVLALDKKNTVLQDKIDNLNDDFMPREVSNSKFDGINTRLDNLDKKMDMILLRQGVNKVSQ